MAVSETILNHVETALRGLPPQEAAIKTKELAAHYGVTTATINRYAAARGIRFRKERKQKVSRRRRGNHVLQHPPYYFHPDANPTKSPCPPWTRK